MSTHRTKKEKKKVLSLVLGQVNLVIAIPLVWNIIYEFHKLISSLATEP